MNIDQAIEPWEGTASLEIDFKNMPRGVRTAVEQESFKTLKITCEPQSPLTQFTYE
jgi:hypothetical protein